MELSLALAETGPRRHRRASWNEQQRVNELRALGRESLHELLLLVLRMWYYWDVKAGAIMAVARTKPACRAFAWGVNAGWHSFCHGMYFATVTSPSLRSEDQVHLCCLAAIYNMNRELASLTTLSATGQDANSDSVPAVASLNLLRAAYMLLMVILQDGTPHAARFDIDIDRLAQCIPGRTLSYDELFALAERESRRPGCQFGVLLRLMREDKVLGVYWKEQELEEEEEPEVIDVED